MIKLSDNLSYSTSIKTKPFLYIELKKMAELKLESENLTEKELKDKAVQNNIFQFDTENRNKEVASITIKRLKVLDDFLMDKVLNDVIEVSKQIAIYSIMKTDRLFFEFMEEVYKEKYKIGDYYLSDKDFSLFFKQKAEQSERVDSWTDYTYYKLKQVYIRILFEAGFINDQKEREIKKPLIPEEIIDHLKSKGDHRFVEAMLGGV